VKFLDDETFDLNHLTHRSKLL